MGPYIPISLGLDFLYIPSLLSPIGGLYIRLHSHRGYMVTMKQTHAQGRMMGKICYKNNGLGMEDLDQECSMWTIGTSILCGMAARS